MCGLPRDKALKQIKETEQHQRDLYTGVIGVLGEETALFVNLRCMQLFFEKIRLYAGAGVTADSTVEMEWNETEMKMSNLQKIINQY